MLVTFEFIVNLLANLSLSSYFDRTRRTKMTSKGLMQKLIVIGDARTGKSCLMVCLVAKFDIQVRYTTSYFLQNSQSTIGYIYYNIASNNERADFKERILDIDSNKVKLQIWGNCI
jgi:GTPase SAR1 family protein